MSLLEDTVEHTLEELDFDTPASIRAAALIPSRPRAQRRDVRLSIVMPAHNEQRTVAQAVAAVLAIDVPCPFELIVVDDGSTDATWAILGSFADRRLRLYRHDVNKGKGAAVRKGIALATGTHLLVFDADLEYSATDIEALVAPVLQGAADVVYGCRTVDREATHQAALYRLGNKVMTGFANVLYRSRINDLHTCLKLVPISLLREMHLTETGFGLDTEITAGLLRRGITPFETPVSYKARSREEGKQINWRDAVRCFSVLMSIRLRPVGAAPETAPVIDLTAPVIIDLR